ncbi:MAG: hypothetical protein JRN25_00100 [Nitrososphaerota archaeon]|nr:hypothetical protein [Nitrososphaerota archaeon]MDG6980217.1 hypothetical protein [Nitrososphaerota archaeon]
MALFLGKRVRLLHDSGSDPSQNLAREDELFALVESSEHSETVRFWTNSECLVRGKAKNARYGWYREGLAEALGVRVFQRETGGGVVYHDIGNLNWSIFARSEGAFHSPAKLFGEASRYMIEGLGRLGIKAEFSVPNKIDVEGRKVSGLAARSTSRAVLVHGTLLLHSDLEKLNRLCIPPVGCPPVANLSQWAEGIRAHAVVAAFGEAMKASGLEVLLQDDPVPGRQRLTN